MLNVTLRPRRCSAFSCLLAWLIISQFSVVADESTVFSGPQVGEPLPAMMVTRPLIDDATEPMEITASDADHPHRLVVFVHQLTRPSVAFTRVLGEYAATRSDDGLMTAVVFLGSDVTELSAAVRRARGALPKNVLIGISPDGLEGPGAYGLNREVTLSVLVASEGKVTFNAALIDPSLPVELPKVLDAICAVAGGEPPKLDSLLGGQTRATMQRGGNGGGEQVPNDQVPGFGKVEPLLRAFIRKSNSDERVDELAKQIEEILKDAPEAKQRVKEIAGRVYKIYGTDHAKEYLRRWADVDGSGDDKDAGSESDSR